MGHTSGRGGGRGDRVEGESGRKRAKEGERGRKWAKEGESGRKRAKEGERGRKCGVGCGRPLRRDWLERDRGGGSEGRVAGGMAGKGTKGRAEGYRRVCVGGHVVRRS